MVKSLERRGILASLPSKTNHHSPFDTKIIDPRRRLRIHDLDPRLLPTKNDDSPFKCARILLQVAFYDHPMSLRMSRLHPTNRVTYQLMVWIKLILKKRKKNKKKNYHEG